ncbi:hypothetical protein K523DRAFT_323921 [Schizophyllum commune Tattone D]|nr:hypothetical protein K523DRAFT_323921 [Schizophyllum commune Tattone D]
MVSSAETTRLKLSRVRVPNSGMGFRTSGKPSGLQVSTGTRKRKVSVRSAKFSRKLYGGSQAVHCNMR